MATTRTEYVNQKGEIVHSDDGIVPDGCHVRVRLDMMDGVQRAIATQSSATVTDAFGRPAGHRRGFVFAASRPATDERAAAYEAESSRIKDAWRNPPTLLDALPPKASNPPVQGDAKKS